MPRSQQINARSWRLPISATADPPAMASAKSERTVTAARSTGGPAAAHNLSSQHRRLSTAGAPAHRCAPGVSISVCAGIIRRNAPNSPLHTWSSAVSTRTDQAAPSSAVAAIAGDAGRLRRNRQRTHRRRAAGHDLQGPAPRRPARSAAWSRCSRRRRRRAEGWRRRARRRRVGGRGRISGVPSAIAAGRPYRPPVAAVQSRSSPSVGGAHRSAR